MRLSYNSNFRVLGLFSTIILGLFLPSVGLALDVTLSTTGPSLKLGDEAVISTAKTSLPRATAADIMCGKSTYMVRFRPNHNHAGLNFSVISKKMTKIKIRWDHSDKILFPFPESKKTVMFPVAGGKARFYFRSHESLSGNIYIMDDQDMVIKKCLYSFLPAKHFRQSIGLSVNGTEYKDLSGSEDSGHNNVSIRYGIRPVTTIPGGGYWSLSVGLSKSESSRDSHRAQGSFNYSW